MCVPKMPTVLLGGEQADSATRGWPACAGQPRGFTVTSELTPLSVPVRALYY